MKHPLLLGHYQQLNEHCSWEGEARGLTRHPLPCSHNSEQHEVLRDEVSPLCFLRVTQQPFLDANKQSPNTS